MDPVKTSRHSAIHYLIILAAGLLAHGMLLLNDGSYADGWFLGYLIKLGQWDRIKDIFYWLGYPIYYWLQLLIGQASIFTFRILSLTWILLTALLQYKILTRFTPLTQRQSLFLAIFALVWPFYHMLVWSIFATGMIFPVLFYAGWYNYLCLKEKKRNSLLYIPSLILIFLSFSYPVFLTYNYAFLAAYGLSTLGYSIKFQAGEFKRELFAFLKCNWVLAILPIVFFYFKTTLYPVSIPYNKINLFSFKTLFSIIKNIFRFITEPVLSIIYSIPTFWFVLIPGLLVVFFVSLKYLKRNPDLEDQKYALGMIGVGLIFIVTLSITYGVVGKTLKIMSVKSRYGFAANLGYSLFFLGGIHWLFNKYWVHKKPLIKPILFLMLVAMILVNTNLYAMWQAKWARTVSIIHNLERSKPVPKASIYFLKDDFPLGVDTREYTSDFTFMLIEAWGQNQFVGITPHYQGKQTRTQAAREIIGRLEDKSLRIHTIIEDFNRKGCLAEVVVSPKKYHQQVLIGFRYLYYRLLKPQQMSQFLEDLTEVKLRPLHINAWDQPCS